MVEKTSFIRQIWRDPPNPNCTFVASSRSSSLAPPPLLVPLLFHRPLALSLISCNPVSFITGGGEEMKMRETQPKAFDWKQFSAHSTPPPSLSLHPLGGFSASPRPPLHPFLPPRL